MVWGEFMNNLETKNVGLFTIEYNDIFSDGNFLILRNGDVYGEYNPETKTAKLYKPQKSNSHVVFLNQKSYDKIYDIWAWGNDKRVNDLFNNYISDYEYYNQNFGDYVKIHNMTYYDNMLLK